MRLKIQWLTVVLVSFSIMGFSQSKKNTIIPRTYVASKTVTPIAIDGDESDPSWSKAEWTDLLKI